MGTESIYNYRKVDDLVITGGQPTAGQLRAAAAEGFQIVVNLDTFGPGYSLDDEAGLVRSLGMEYHALPVDWQSPRDVDFEVFERLLQSLPAARTLIHCAANFRVSTFYALYGLRHLGWSEAQAEAFRDSIWRGSDYPQWEALWRRLKPRPGG